MNNLRSTWLCLIVDSGTMVPSTWCTAVLNWWLWISSRLFLNVLYLSVPFIFPVTEPVLTCLLAHSVLLLIWTGWFQCVHWKSPSFDITLHSLKHSSLILVILFHLILNIKCHHLFLWFELVLFYIICHTLPNGNRQDPIILFHCMLDSWFKQHLHFHLLLILPLLLPFKYSLFSLINIFLHPLCDNSGRNIILIPDLIQLCLMENFSNFLFKPLFFDFKLG